MLWDLFSVKIRELEKGAEFYFKRGNDRKHIVEGENGSFIQAKEAESFYIVNFDKDITVYCRFKYLPQNQKTRVKKEISFGILFLITLIIIIFSSL